MNHRLKFISFLVLFQMLAVNAQRKSILLNSDWQFTEGYVVQKDVTTRVDIPHTWNRTDAPNGKIDYYRGLGNYEKMLFIDSDWKTKRLFLKFDGVNTIANVFINGKHLGEHRGGYTSFTYEITDKVNYGEENTVMVRVNNAPQLDVMPLLGDFNFYGGIYRDVNLILTDRACISPLDYASPGVYLSQKKVSKANATIEAKIQLSNPEALSNLKLRVKVLEGKKVRFEKLLAVDADQSLATVAFDIKNPRLWNGVQDPFIHDVEVTLERAGKMVDKVVQPLGLRFYHIDAKKGFFLNGEYLRLKGVCRHQDRSEFGNALRREHHEEDMELIKEIGANSIRLSHYPYDPYFYELLDKNGIVAWSEIPFVGPGGYRDKGFVDQPSFKENGKQQLIEMIRQNYNHPSVFFWGIFNELNQVGDDPVQYVQELNMLAHQEDPTRPTTSASNKDGDINFQTDLIGWNKYYGWYGGDASDIGVWADATHKEFPELKISISEYGAGGSIYHHADELKKPGAGGMWHPEEWQAHYHEEYWKVIDQRPFLWGTFIWNLFDFGAAHRTEGDVLGRNDKGLVTYDRNYKKDAFWFYKANWNKKDHFAHIANRRYEVRKEKETDIKVYSNCSEVQLFVNGKSFGKMKGDYGTFVWKGIQLVDGNNTIAVKAKNGKKTYSDTCTWKVNTYE